MRTLELERRILMSELYQSLSHSKWDCKYQVVFVPKRRRKVIFGKTRQHLGPIFHALARQKDYRRTPDAGPCAYVHRDSPQAPGSFGDRIFEGEERNCYCPAVREGAEFQR